MTLEHIEARRRRWKLYMTSLGVLLLTTFFSICIGSSLIPFEETLKVFFKWLLPSMNVDPLYEQIIWTIRLPRVLMGCMVGAALSLAGALLQGIFRNPMADPYVIGVSSGAALGASIAIVLGFGFTIFGSAAISSMAFIFAMTSLIIVYSLSRVGGKVPVMTLLLSGIAVGILFSAITSFLSLFVGEKLANVYFWLLGNLSKSEWNHVVVSAPVLISCSVVAMLYARDLNLMSMGEDTAISLGIDVENTKLVLITISSLMTSIAVSFTGMIAFVGLMVPHIVRLIVGPDHRVLLPCSTLFGALFLIVCDDMARAFALITSTQIPVGIITALAGGPFFIYLLRRRKKEYSL
ncbi:MAG: iron chelate uptake ABC transporter family permease subunit [Candidatus Nezhaarchaeales archaeon]